MVYIGTIPIQVWTKTQELARKTTEQPPHCPFIILTKPLPDQLIALCGHFSKQHIELYLMEVPTPDLKPKDRLPLSDDDYSEARSKADTLLSQAICESDTDVPLPMNHK